MSFLIIFFFALYYVQVVIKVNQSENVFFSTPDISTGFESTVPKSYNSRFNIVSMINRASEQTGNLQWNTGVK